MAVARVDTVVAMPMCGVDAVAARPLCDGCGRGSGMYAPAAKLPRDGRGRRIADALCMWSRHCHRMNQQQSRCVMDADAAWQLGGMKVLTTARATPPCGSVRWRRAANVTADVR